MKESDRIAALAEGLTRPWAPPSRSAPTASSSQGGRPLRGATVRVPRRPPDRHGAGGRRARRRGRDRDRGGRVRLGLLPRVLRLPRARGRRREPHDAHRARRASWARARARSGPLLARAAWVGASSTSTTGSRTRAGRRVAEIFARATARPSSGARSGRAAEAAALGTSGRRGRRRRLRGRRDPRALCGRAPSPSGCAATSRPLLGRIPADGSRPLAANRERMRRCSPSGSPPTAWPT